jgi:hypothetical protein
MVRPVGAQSTWIHPAIWVHSVFSGNKRETAGSTSDDEDEGGLERLPWPHRESSLKISVRSVRWLTDSAQAWHPCVALSLPDPSIGQGCRECPDYSSIDPGGACRFLFL